MKTGCWVINSCNAGRSPGASLGAVLRCRTVLPGAHTRQVRMLNNDGVVLSMPAGS